MKVSQLGSSPLSDLAQTLEVPAGIKSRVGSDVKSGVQQSLLSLAVDSLEAVKILLGSGPEPCSGCRETRGLLLLNSLPSGSTELLMGEGNCAMTPTLLWHLPRKGRTLNEYNRFITGNRYGRAGLT